jgi:hypothetical protein
MALCYPGLVQKRRGLIACVLVACLLWHGRMLWIVWSLISGETGGADFASYYYAALEAMGGGSPYDVAALNDLAGRDSGEFFAVQPYFYPPPFLLLLSWVGELRLSESLRIWFVLNEVALVGLFFVLVTWGRKLADMNSSPVALAILALAFSGSTFAVNLSLGQANLFVMVAAITGVGCVENRRPWFGGGLVGLACIAKMSPALFILWWCLEGRWRAVAAACGAALLASVLVLPITGPEVQVLFYSEVLPGFASGDYNGLRMPVGIMGNHSIPNLFHQLLSDGPQLSAAARSFSRVATIALLCGLGWSLRTGEPAEQPSDALGRAARVSLIAIALIVIPVFAYEHHLVWAVPAFAVAGVAILEGRLARAWAAPLFISWLAWATDPALLREPYHALREVGGPVASLLGLALQEAKFVAILVAGAAVHRVATTTPESLAEPSCD